MAAVRRILVVEDEEAIRVGVRDALKFAGFEVLEAGDGAEGLRLARAQRVDLVLLDLLLPATEGLEVLRRIRESDPSLPVIILTARGSENDRVAGLKLGADDYVVKPFSARELLARIDAVLRRSPERPNPALRMKLYDWVVDCARQEMTRPDGEVVRFSELETLVLRTLAARKGQVVGREELLSGVWGIQDGRVETRAIDMQITRLRNKLGPDPQRWIITVRGRGYMLGNEVEVLDAAE